MPDQHITSRPDPATAQSATADPALTSPDLETVRDYVWSTLEHAVRDRRHAMHTVVVASMREGGADARVVVLRGADANSGKLRFHTDARSQKIDDLAACNKVTVLAYDAAAKTQIRMAGIAHVHIGDDVARSIWDASRWFSLHCYHQIEAPGVPVAAPPDAVRPPMGTEREAGFENFAVVTVALTRIDWLYLAAAGHRRAQFARTSNGTWSGQWVAP